MAQALQSEGEQVDFFELNYGILPRFRDVAGFFLRRKVGTRHAPGELHAGMKARPSSPLRASVYMLWYGLDYFLGRFRHPTNRPGKSVIFARFLYDYAYQRAYQRAPRMMFRCMAWLAQKPKFVFTIERNPHEIFAGKPELTVEEIQRQQDSITSLLAGKPNFHVLDGSGGVEDTVAQALALIAKGAQT